MFQCQRGYTLRKIKGVSHLLPYGQQMADQKKGMILNETGTFLWNVIQHTEGSEPETLAEMLARLYGLGEEAFPEVLNDVNDFLSQMTALGMITESLKPISHACTASMKIAGLSINFYGLSSFLATALRIFMLTIRQMNQIRKLNLSQVPLPATIMGRCFFAIRI